ncbi:hypothetical protein HYPSUDRAFT_363729 [Hypholoma sublateritium FD-334 SS-4]|uniref:Uncharacterized protein n=1 Tax=Hypholoma sublateritium (strain FD-334 SS-4) TaxID=945553 RepID=A0A0D2LXE3_HYPSF|nr:hypothetical protein HYPSUDRAFT_363729 [Hypholoma sublateritium FD-334 SS-4]
MLATSMDAKSAWTATSTPGRTQNHCLRFSLRGHSRCASFRASCFLSDSPGRGPNRIPGRPGDCSGIVHGVISCLCLYSDHDCKPFLNFRLSLRGLLSIPHVFLNVSVAALL